jgi:hypothetical protein
MCLIVFVFCFWLFIDFCGVGELLISLFCSLFGYGGVVYHILFTHLVASGEHK